MYVYVYAYEYEYVRKWMSKCSASQDFDLKQIVQLRWHLQHLVQVIVLLLEDMDVLRTQAG